MATSRSPLPASLRRSANRRATPRAAPPRRLRDAAEAGVVTRRNTKAGSAGRQAADAELYARRQARGRRLGAASARAAVGHGGPRFAMSGVFEGRGWIILEDLSPGERRRVARWNALASNLTTGDISATTFRRRVRTWRPLRGERFESDPLVVEAILDQRRQAGLPLFTYPMRRT